MNLILIPLIAYNDIRSPLILFTSKRQGNNRRATPKIRAATIKLSATRDSSDGSSVSDKVSLRASIALCDAEPPYTESTDGHTPAATAFPVPSTAPPPFSSLYFPSQSSPEQLPASIIEPAPPPFSPVSPAPTLSNVEVETKAALSGDSKGESSKSAEDEEAPPPYTEGSSPLESFTYVMAAAGGAASIITQVQQSSSAPVNTLAGRATIVRFMIQMLIQIF